MTAQLRGLPTTAGTWTVSDSRTRTAFAVGNFGRLVHGSIACSWGEVEVDGSGSPVRARAEFDLCSLDTGIAKRDSDLRKPRLLDIDRHPMMSWRCDRFEPAADGAWIADGTLSVRGTTAPLPITCRADAAGLDGEWLRVTAAGVLDRRTVGIRSPSFLIGTLVEISVDAWLTPARR